LPRTSVAKPGAALRAFRRKQGWTLAEVSQKTGLPVSTLSRIETDQISPTYDQLSKLSLGLNIDMAQLLSGDMEDAKRVQTARRSVNRAGDGQILETPMQSLRYLSVDLTNKQFAPIIGEIKAHSLEEAGEFHRHNGEEFIFVVSGELELHSESYAPLRLHPVWRMPMWLRVKSTVKFYRFALHLLKTWPSSVRKTRGSVGRGRERHGRPPEAANCPELDRSIC
jgi:transcriptional regulator with XRE-family HTH domain